MRLYLTAKSQRRRRGGGGGAGRVLEPTDEEEEEELVLAAAGVPRDRPGGFGYYLLTAGLASLLVVAIQRGVLRLGG